MHCRSTEEGGDGRERRPTLGNKCKWSHLTSLLPLFRTSQLTKRYQYNAVELGGSLSASKNSTLRKLTKNITRISSNSTVFNTSFAIHTVTSDSSDIIVSGSWAAVRTYMVACLFALRVREGEDYISLNTCNACAFARA